MTEGWSKKLGTGLFEGGKKLGTELLKAGKATADNIQLRGLQKQIRDAILAASAHQDIADVSAALSRLPDNWQTLDLTATKALADEHCPKLHQAALRAISEKERRHAQELEERRQQAFEAGLDRREAQLADDGSILEVSAGNLLPDDARQILIEKAAEEFHKRSTRQSLSKSLKEPNGIRDINEVAKTIIYGRAVGDLLPQEKQTLLVAIQLARHGLLDEQGVDTAFAAMTFNDGKTTIIGQDFNDDRGFDKVRRDTEEKVRDTIRQYLETPNDIIQHVGSYISKLEDTELPKEAISAIRSVSGGGATWFGTSDVPGSIYSLETGTGLFLGRTDDGGFLHYDGEGSLFTIAPPGSGKTQCQVMPNLLMYGGPAIVLDVKGECYRQTAGFRASTYGKVIRFAPDDWDGSAHYNPLDFVRRDPRYLASDARKLADMLIVPQATKDPYWEQRGRDILAAFIGYVAHCAEGEQRTMKSVMDLLSPSPDMLQEVVDALRESGISYLSRAANQIESLSENQRASIFDSARSQLSVWDLGELDALTDRSDWHPSDFKLADEATTLYICVSPADIQRFASVLRVIVGQHLDYFMEVLPENMDRPVVFFLDEAPQLGSFDPLPKASSLGRQYGLRLWLFAQNRNQIETAYADANTILGNSVVQCWMNPDESVAFELSKNLGQTRGLFDGREKPLAEAHELRGPSFRDTIIVVGRGEKPAKLSKHFAFEDESLVAKMGSPIAERTVPANTGMPSVPSADSTNASTPNDTSQPS